MALLALPIKQAALDNRDIQSGDLFIAVQGPNADGHDYVGAAIQSGAQAVICEERGRRHALENAAVIVDCTLGRWETQASLPPEYHTGVPLVYVVDNSVIALQNVGAFQRLHRTQPDLRVIGVTGSIGKTSTKELTAAVMRQRYSTMYSQGNLNSEQGLPLALMTLDFSHECAVLEMGMYAQGEIERLCQLGRPQVGIVTNVGPVHLERLGSIERIAQAKAELPASLPPADEGGVAILNWDDERVVAMAGVTRARIFRYGLTPEADLWADAIESAGMAGIRFRFHHRQPDSGRIESLQARVPLLGRHSVHTALRAAAAGLVMGMGWDEIVAGMQDMPAQLRLVTVTGVNGCTVIDDTYNASPASTVAALNLLADLEPGVGGRRIAVLGDMLELGSYSDEGHKLVGRRAADVADVLITVGKLGRTIGDEAENVGLDARRIRRLPVDREAVALVREMATKSDIILVKGSRAVGMDWIVAQITSGVNGRKAQHSEG
jgi:UDP-N-acetylmuramoyl-tripeptide--D-alanyl-D-alanine ligase